MYKSAYNQSMQDSKQQKIDDNIKIAPQKYHPFRIPPYIQLSQLHRECSQFGQINKPQLQNQVQQRVCCPCCNQPSRSELKILCDITEIYQTSQPVGYYFTYLKTMGVALFFIMMAYGIYTLIQIINHCNSDQTGEQGECVYVYGIPIPKIHIFFSITLIIMNCVVILFLYAVVAYLFFQNAYLHQRNVCNNEKPSDFSLLLSGFEHDKLDSPTLYGFFQSFQIQDIIYTYKIDRYMDKLSQKSVLEAKRDLYCALQQKKEYEHFQQKINKIDDRLLHIKNQFVLGQDVGLRTDKIIVTFVTYSQKKRFEQLYKMNLSKNIYHTFKGSSPLMIADQNIFIEPLGEPYQIIWQNLEIKSQSRYLRILVSNLISVLILLGSFVLIVFLSKMEKNNQTVGDDIFMSVLFAVLIEVVNTFLVSSISRLTSWEKRYTKTGQISVMLYKKSLAFFLNTTFLPFCLFVFTLFQPDEDDLIRNILTIFFISNMISPILGFYIHPRFLYRVYQRSKIKKQIQKKTCITTQIKANAIFQKQTFMLDQRYALASQLITNCMFYAAIFPVGVFITIFGIIITYWSSKIWLIKYCAVPKFSYRIGRNVNLIGCLFPCVYAFGFAANLYMVKYPVNFNRSYSLYIAAFTIPITILFLLFGQKIVMRYIRKNRTSVTECLAKKTPLFSYKNLNPTSFLHSNVGLEHFQSWIYNQKQVKNSEQPQKHDSGVSRTGSRPKDMWNNLVSYVMAKQMGIKFTEDGNQQNKTIYRNSKSYSQKSKKSLEGNKSAQSPS